MQRQGFITAIKNVTEKKKEKTKHQLDYNSLYTPVQIMGWKQKKLKRNTDSIPLSRY